MAFTDASDRTRVKVGGGLSLDKKIFTTAIQGDLDTDGSMFSELQAAFR